MDSPNPTAPPIPPHLFALALTSLPLDALYAKAAELQNAITHLLASNIEMKPYADDGDAICREAIVENDIVIARVEERVALVRAEVQGRGQRWSGDAHGEDADGRAGRAQEEVRGNGVVNGNGVPVAQRGGRLTDEELRRRMEAQMGADAEEDEEEEEDGVHL